MNRQKDKAKGKKLTVIPQETRKLTSSSSGTRVVGAASARMRE